MTLIDRKIGEVLDTLKKRGMYGDTPDSFHLGSRGNTWEISGVATKAQYCSEALMRVPFLLKPPVADFKGYPEDSLYQLCGNRSHLPDGGRPAGAGKYFAPQPDPVLSGRRKGAVEDIYMEARDIHAIRDSHYKLIYYQNRDYGEFCMIRSNDPHEKYNLWDDPGVQKEKPG